MATPRIEREATGGFIHTRPVKRASPREMASSRPGSTSRPAGWDFQTKHGSLSYQYEKDDTWLLSASASSKSFADFAALGGNTEALRPSLSQRELENLPSLKIRSRTRNTVIGCMPDEVIETRDWRTSAMNHGPMSAGGGRMAGSASKFGVKDPSTGRIEYGVVYGVPEALGVTRPSVVNLHASASQKHLRKSPSMAELDELLRRRSRARGRGGSCTQVVNIIQPKWNVMNGAASSSSVMRPTQ